MTPPKWLVLAEDYLALRRDRGFAVEQLGWFLRDFARYTERTEHRGPLTVDLAVRWALSSGRGDPARAERRLWAFDSSRDTVPRSIPRPRSHRQACSGGLRAASSLT